MQASLGILSIPRNFDVSPAFPFKDFKDFKVIIIRNKQLDITLSPALERNHIYKDDALSDRNYIVLFAFNYYLNGDTIWTNSIHSAKRMQLELR